MQLVNETALTRTIRKHRDARQWISSWVQVARAAEWHSLGDVRRHYDSVKLRSGTVVTVFNVMGNNYRLLTLIDYSRQRIHVADVLTHAEYNKNKWKRRGMKR